MSEEAQPLFRSLKSVVDATSTCYLHRQACDSPIEEIMAGALVAMFNKAGAEVEWTTEPEKSEAHVVIVPQFKIGRYRADFLVRWIPGNKSVVVECDGHDFHRASYEQIERDRIRDQNIEAQGYTVMRFTGREIHKDAFSCAWQVVEAMGAQMS